MSERLVELEGGKDDLDFLVREQWTPALSIENIEQKTYLRSTAVAAAASNEAAYAEAQKLMRWINGAARLLRCQYAEVRAATVCERAPDGGMQRYIFGHGALSGAGRAIGYGSVMIDGVPVTSPPPPPPPPTIAEWIALATRAPAAALALELVTEAAGRWAELFRIVESVKLQFDTDADFARAIGKLLARQFRRFRTSANDARPGERHKRHAPDLASMAPQPSVPDMTIPDGERYMGDVVA